MLDLVIRGGKIVDGTGAPMRTGEVCIRGDRIAHVGERSGEAAVRILDVDGMAIAPGFIDVHSHYDGLLLSPKPDASAVAQGITTTIVGNCGFTLAPINPPNRELLIAQASAIVGGDEVTWAWQTFGDYLHALELARPPVNVGALVGHNAVRVAAMGFEMRAARADEVDAMRGLVRESMRAGALGLSTGLVYPPGTFAGTDEVVALAREVKPFGGVYTSHIRNEANRLIEAVNEAIHIGAEAEVPVQISHCKAAGSTNWGKGAALVQTIRDARGRGLDVSGDQYPYTAGSTMLSTLLPPWAHEGGVPETLARLRSSEMRARMQHDIENGVGDWWNPSRNTTWDKVLIASAPRMPGTEGQTVAQLARAQAQSPLATVFEMLERTQCQVLMVIFLMNEDDVRTIMRDENIMVGTDALATGSRPHPRAYGTYPRILGKYARDEQVIGLEEAIRKMTAMPAQKFGLTGRGSIREGAYADLVVFDPKAVGDTATYDAPIAFPRGMPYVIVNGALGVDDGHVTGARVGKVLRRNSA